MERGKERTYANLIDGLEVEERAFQLGLVGEGLSIHLFNLEHNSGGKGEHTR